MSRTATPPRPADADPAGCDTPRPTGGPAPCWPTAGPVVLTWD